MDFAAGPLVWIDCEMTGLDPRTDKILEIAVRWFVVPFESLCSVHPSLKVLITNGNLETVDKGISYIIKTDKEVLDKYVLPHSIPPFDSHP